jgi:hypothetical protein
MSAAQISELADGGPALPVLSLDPSSLSARSTIRLDKNSIILVATKPPALAVLAMINLALV